MANLLKTLPSGAQIEVTMAPFEEGDNLFCAFLQEAESVKLDLGKDFNGFKNLIEMDISTEMLNTIKNLLFRVLYSQKVRAALWPVLARCTYNGHKICRDTFDDETARGDFITVIKEVSGFNLRPFLKNQSSFLTDLIQKSSGTQKQPSPQDAHT